LHHVRGKIGKCIQLLFANYFLSIGNAFSIRRQSYMYIVSLFRILGYCWLEGDRLPDRGTCLSGNTSGGVDRRPQNRKYTMTALHLDQDRMQIAFGEGQLSVTGIERRRRTLVQEIGFPMAGEGSA
jgi:hypothetical protein